LFVKSLVFLAGGKTLDKFGPGLIGFAGKQNVTQAIEEGLIHGSVGSTDDREDPHFTERAEDLSHAISLNDHSRNTHDIETFEGLEINFFDVFVEEANFMVRHQPGDMRQGSCGHRTLLVAGVERQRVVEAPIGGLELWIDKTNFQSLHDLRLVAEACIQVND